MLPTILFALSSTFYVLADSDLYANTDVTILTDKDFHSIIDNHELALVEFYAPWCGHCKNLAPTYQNVAQELKDQKVLVAAVDVTKQSATGSEYDVKGFPTISIFSNGKRVVKEYNGERTAPAMVDYMKRLIETKGVPPSASAYDDSDVVVLTDKNFDSVLKNNEIVFVEFYAPWCTHCQSLTPIFKEVATKVKDNDIVLAALESTEFEAIADRYNVQGYPTLILFRNGEVDEEYSGEHTKKAMMSFFREKSGDIDSIINIDTEDELNDFLKNDLVVLTHFQKENEVLLKTFKDGVEQFVHATEKLKVGKIEDTKLAKKLGWHYSPAAKLIRKADNYETKFDFFKTSTNVNKVREWILNNMFPPVSEYSEDVADVLSMGTSPIVVYFAKGPLDIPEEILTKLEAFAKTFNNDMTFFWLDHTKTDMISVNMGDINPDPNQEYIKILADKKVWTKNNYDKTKQPLDEAVSEFFTEWMTGDKSGGEERFFPELSTTEGQNPEDVDQDGPVFNLIASIFQQTVEDSAPDFFIEFYAPWCGHCKSLQPKWDELAEQLADTDVVVAKMDATANDIPHEYKVEGFPTILFVKKLPDGTKKRIEYSGGREVEDMKKWVLSQHEPGPHNKRPAEPFSYYPAPIAAKNQDDPLEGFDEEKLEQEMKDKRDKLLEDTKKMQEESEKAKAEL